MKKILKSGQGENGQGSNAELHVRHFRRGGRGSRSPAVQGPHRMASFSAVCLSTTQGVVEDTGETDVDDLAKSRRQQRSFSLPPTEHPVLCMLGPNAHTSWGSQSCRLHLGGESRGRNCGRMGARLLAATRTRRRSCKETAIFDALVDGSVFASRYKMEGKPFDAKPHCRLAVDVVTGQRVFLKFYPPSGREFQNAIRMHRALQTKACVCKLIDTLPHKDGYPPCLVFEAGAFTLAQRFERSRPSALEQQALVHSIVEGVSAMHAQGIVHGNLDPSHIMWFATDFTWKLVNLDAATTVGDTVPVEHITARRYAAPEIRRAIEQRSKQTRLECASDMWTVGLIAFEIFTGATVRESVEVQRYVTRLLKEGTKQGESMHNGKTAEGTAHEKLNEQRNRELQFVAALLIDHPRDRTTAALICGEKDWPFASLSVAQPTDALKNFVNGGRMLDGAAEEWLVSHIACEHLDVSLSAERFTSAEDLTVAFYARDTQKMRHFYDDALPERPIYVLPAGEAFRLRVSVQSDGHFAFPLKEITAVDVQPPDGKANALEIWQQREGDRLMALALLDPSTFHSDRLNAARAMFAVADKKHVQLTVRIRLHLADGYPAEICLCRDVYLHFKRPSMKLDFLKGLAKYRRGGPSRR